ncbi:MAG: hypothetical protein IJZ86_01225 [Bacteroides sp.]|nr:hypothetical protein [Bacteroides sp.]
MKKERNIEQEKAERIKKREYLKRLSKSLVARRDMGEYMGNETDTVNGLLRFYYACNGYTNLKTFSEWKEQGFIVRKGEKGLLLWARPVSTKAEKERAEEAKKKGLEDEAKEDYFPICYLFAEKQVHKMDN